MPRPLNRTGREGDWKCINCSGVVFSHKLKCKCGQHRYTKSASYLKMTYELSPSYCICVSRWQSDITNCLTCKNKLQVIT